MSEELYGKKSQETGPVGGESNGSRQKNRRGDRKVESNDSLERSYQGETHDQKSQVNIRLIVKTQHT